MQTETLANGLPINSHTALSIPAYWRAMNFLADNLASFGRSVFKDGAPVEKPHPLDKILKREPNPMQSAFDFWRTFFFHVEHRGNGYAYIRRPSPVSQDVAELHNLLPEDVRPFRIIPESGNVFDASVWYYHAPSRAALPAADVIHCKGLAHDGLLGYEPCEVMRGVLERAKSLERYAFKYLDKGSLIKGSIEMPAGTTKEQADEIVSNLMQYRQKTNERDVLVLTGGATLNNKTISATDSKLIEQDRELTKKIAQITGVSPQYLFEQSESKYNNSVEQAGLDVVRFTFRNRLVSIESELSRKLLAGVERDAGYEIKLNADALLRGDTKTQTDTVVSTVAGGIRTKNEGRAVLGLPKDSSPESDTLLTPHAVASAPTDAKQKDAADAIAAD
ncbi:MAG: phage portal protein [Tepidisphaeraceae bacterium]